VSADSSRSRTRNRGCSSGCGAGCGGFFFVLIVGVLLSIFHIVVGVGVSVRVPLTQSNVTVAGSVGQKDKVLGALPDYVQGRLGRNQNFFNNSTTMTIGPAEGAGLIVIGQQGGAPAIDLHVFLH
jgi:hypothetical protein